MIQCGEGTIFSSNNVVNIFITIQRNTGICWNAVRSEMRLGKLCEPC